MSDWVVRLIDQSGYLGIGFLMFLETIFPPIPSEVIMPVAGVAAGQGKLHYGLVVASGTAGAMLGNIVWYLAARAAAKFDRTLLPAVLRKQATSRIPSAKSVLPLGRSSDAAGCSSSGSTSSAGAG